MTISDFFLLSKVLGAVVIPTMEHKTELQNVCNLIDGSTLGSTEDIKAIYTRLYELIVKTYEDDAFIDVLHRQIMQVMNKMVVKLFHEHLHTRNMFELSTWIGFLESTLQAFKAFFHQALAPFIVHCQDQFVSPFMKEKHHPFRQCVKVLQSLYQANKPVLQEAVFKAVDDYVQSCSSTLLHRDSSSAQQEYTRCWTLLKAWFGHSVTLRLGYSPAEYVDESFVSYLPSTFGDCHMHSCESFYGFFHHLYDIGYAHLTLFRAVPTPEQQQKIAVDIGYHYNLYQHWSFAKGELRGAQTTDDTCLFSWEDVQRAFVEHNGAQCQHYQRVMLDKSSSLSRYKLFNNQARCSLLTDYILRGVTKQPKDLGVLKNYFYFVDENMTEYTDASHSRLLFLLGSTIYAHFFENITQDAQHKHLMRIYMEAFVHEREWQWFIHLWNHTPNKDCFLHRYIESHLRPSIIRAEVNTHHEDAFLLLCTEKCHEECPSQLHTYRTLLNEWHHRSVDSNTFVVNRSQWAFTASVPVQLHSTVRQLIQKKTDKYQVQFKHRQVDWCLSTTQATVTFTSPHNTTMQLRIHANLFALNLLIWIHGSVDCKTDEFERLLSPKDRTTNHLQVVHDYLDYFLTHNVVHYTQTTTSTTTNKGICLNYDNTNEIRTLTDLPNCLVTHPQHASRASERVDAVMLDRKSVMEATVVRVLKAHKESMDTGALQNRMAKSIQSFEVDNALFDKTLRALVDRDYVCFQDSEHRVQYVP